MPASPPPGALVAAAAANAATSLLLLLLLLVAAAPRGASAAHVCSASMPDVLREIYNATGGPGWRANDWFQDEDYCEWAGIVCNQNRDIIQLELNGMGLVGAIPDALECLPFLKSLYLNDNSLVGPIPTAICALTSLKYLQIRNSGLVGEIPECLCNLRYTQYIDLDRNALTGTIPTCVGNIEYLRELHLMCNDLSGTIPAAGFNSLAYLQTLQVQCNANLICSPSIDARDYACGTDSCDQCPAASTECSEIIDMGACGLYKLVEAA